MTKKRSKCLFVLFAILLVICLIATFVNFTYPLTIGGNYYSYSSFVDNIKLGQDISSSLRIVYRGDIPEGERQDNYDNLREATIASLRDIVASEGYKDVTVTSIDDNGILLQAGNINSKEDETKLSSLVGNPQKITFATDTEGKEVFASSRHIKKVTAESFYQQGATEATQYYVLVEFKDEYHDMVAEKSKSKNVHIMLGDTEFATLDYSKSTNGNDSIQNGLIYLQSESFKSLNDAQTCANQIKTGMLALELTQIENSMITPTYGLGSDLFLAVAMAVFVIAAFVYLIVKYKHMGWLASFAILFFVTIGLFLIQSIPFAHINFAGMIGMMIAFIVALDSLITIFERAKAHYQNDIKLYVAFKQAQKESLGQIIFTNLLLIITGLICVFMPSISLQSFGWTALVLPFVTLFISLALMRLFIKMYLALNNTKGEKCNFHKGGKNA